MFSSSLRGLAVVWRRFIVTHVKALPWIIVALIAVMAWTNPTKSDHYSALGGENPFLPAMLELAATMNLGTTMPTQLSRYHNYVVISTLEVNAKDGMWAKHNDNQMHLASIGLLGRVFIVAVPIGRK